MLNSILPPRRTSACACARAYTANPTSIWHGALPSSSVFLPFRGPQVAQLAVMRSNCWQRCPGTDMEWGSGNWLRRGRGWREGGRGKEEENAKGSLERWEEEEEVGRKHERKVRRRGKARRDGEA